MPPTGPQLRMSAETSACYLFGCLPQALRDGMRVQLIPKEPLQLAPLVQHA